MLKKDTKHRTHFKNMRHEQDKTNDNDQSQGLSKDCEQLREALEKHSRVTGDDREYSAQVVYLLAHACLEKLISQDES